MPHPTDDEIEFCRQQLSKELTVNRLRQQFDIKGGKEKHEVVESVVQGLVRGTISEDDVLKAITNTHRRWFTILRCNGFSPPKHLLKPRRLLWSGGDGWFGPVPDEGRDWYVYQKKVTEITLEIGGDVDPEDVEFDEANIADSVEVLDNGVTKVRQQILFRVFVEVQARFIVLHWENISFDRKGADGLENLGSKHWKWVKSIIGELTALNGDLEAIDAYDLIMNGLWTKFRHSEGHEWKDIATRTMKSGVLVNARSGADKTHEGLTELAHRLSKTALDAVKQGSPDNLQIAQKAVLESIIREGGVRSYELELRQKEPERFLFRVHAYFGTQFKNGQDSLVHYKAYLGEGGSNAAVEFLRRQLPDRFS